MTQKRIGDSPSLQIDAANHESIQTMLPEYVMLLIRNEEPPPEWNVLQRHLKSCAICRDEAEALTQSMLETYAGPLPETPAPLDPDLRFLRSGYTNSGSIPLLLTIQLSIVLTERSRAPTRDRTLGLISYEYTLPKTRPTDPDVILQVLNADEHADHGQLRILVEQDVDNPMNQPPLRVTLRIGGVIHETSTDPRGVASFENVPLKNSIAGVITIM